MKTHNQMVELSQSRCLKLGYFVTNADFMAMKATPAIPILVYSDDTRFRNALGSYLSWAQECGLVYYYNWKGDYLFIISFATRCIVDTICELLWMFQVSRTYALILDEDLRVRYRADARPWLESIGFRFPHVSINPMACAL